MMITALTAHSSAHRPSSISSHHRKITANLPAAGWSSANSTIIAITAPACALLIGKRRHTLCSSVSPGRHSAAGTRGGTDPRQRVRHPESRRHVARHITQRPGDCPSRNAYATSAPPGRWWQYRAHAGEQPCPGISPNRSCRWSRRAPQLEIGIRGRECRQFSFQIHKLVLRALQILPSDLDHLDRDSNCLLDHSRGF
jgi:hypothetical protein